MTDNSLYAPLLDGPDLAVSVQGPSDDLGGSQLTKRKVRSQSEMIVTGGSTTPRAWSIDSGVPDRIGIDNVRFGDDRDKDVAPHLEGVLHRSYIFEPLYMTYREAGEPEIRQFQARSKPDLPLPVPPSTAANSNPSTPKAVTRGNIYFIRHGESTANEQNVYSGNVWDVPLTRFGVMQARNGGGVVKSKGLVFDEVHVSHLRRAKQTMENVLNASGHGTVPVFEDSRISERDFGVWTRQNKNLLMQSFGHSQFEHLLQSPYAAPLHGESLAKMYYRTKEYLEQVLQPAAESGRNILVVSHQYILEMVGLILTGMRPEEYFDFTLPNAKPMSEGELRKYVKAESETRKNIADFVTIHFSSISVFALAIGIILKLIIRTDVSTLATQAWIAVFLGLSSFWVMLDVDARELWRNKKAVRILGYSAIPWAIRFGVAAAVVLTTDVQIVQDMALLFLIPPALTAPTLSQLWGGSFHVALSTTILLSVIAPAIIALLSITSSSNLTASSLKGFFAILAIGLVAPSILAQGLRFYSPVLSKSYATKYKFIGVLAMSMLALGGGYHYTPSNLYDIIFRVSCDAETNLNISIANGIYVTIGFVIMKYIGRAVSRQFGGRVGAVALAPSHSTSALFECFSWVWDHLFGFSTSAYAADVYITFTTPNIFLWISLLTSKNSETCMCGFWVLIIFFLATYFDDIWIIGMHSERCLLSDIQANSPKPLVQGWLTLLAQKPESRHNKRRYLALTETQLLIYSSPDNFYHSGFLPVNAELVCRPFTDRDNWYFQGGKTPTHDSHHSGDAAEEPSMADSDGSDERASPTALGGAACKSNVDSARNGRRLFCQHHNRVLVFEADSERVAAEWLQLVNMASRRVAESHQQRPIVHVTKHITSE